MIESFSFCTGIQHKQMCPFLGEIRRKMKQGFQHRDFRPEKSLWKCCFNDKKKSAFIYLLK